MQHLRRLMAEEQPGIAAALEAALAKLPPNASGPAGHVLRAGGKRLRPLLTLLWGRVFGLAHTDLYTLGAAVEMLHAATLLHDDILDRAELRRGKPAAHTVFGLTESVLAGDAMLAGALLMVSRLGDARLTASISEAVMHTAEGEAAELASLRNLNVDQEAYLAMITGKTAWMLRAACELGALRAGADPAGVEAAARFGLELGIAFQLVDDCLDFSPPEETGKPQGGDLREGKATPPLLLYLADLDPQRRAVFTEHFTAGTLDEADVEAVCREIYAGGYAKKARALAEERLASAASALQGLFLCPELAALGEMCDYIRNRSA
jgi:octaprenyl-diphosphate synthase